MLFNHHESGGEMWTGEGPREIRRYVEFGHTFIGNPAVHVSLGLIDSIASSNLRTDISAADVTKDGFTILFRTWGDSRLARIRADWLAIGPGYDPAIWALD
ncbi:H-type lectin domain-containing protein [Palleronia caenipelagi]|nr:H-type lectin domain-containing protein [Palleronia caenipelagi]